MELPTSDVYTVQTNAMMGIEANIGNPVAKTRKQPIGYYKDNLLPDFKTFLTFWTKKIGKNWFKTGYVS